MEKKHDCQVEGGVQETEWEESAMEAMASPEGEHDGRPRFIIDDDVKADWAVRKIREEQAEYERISSLAGAQMEAIEQKLSQAARRYEQATGYLRSLLFEYFLQVPHKCTKTQESYRLLSGRLIMKLPKQKAEYDDGELVAFLKGNGYQDYIKTEEKPKWGEFKKLLEYSGQSAVVKDSGELVECIQMKEIPMKFDVEVE